MLLWVAIEPERVPASIRTLLEDQTNKIYFSAASFFEISIKIGLGRQDFQIDPARLRRGLRENGYVELQITVDHTLVLRSLLKIHKDPFDRILVAQAMSEGLVLLTSDSVLARYPGPGLSERRYSSRLASGNPL